MALNFKNFKAESKIKKHKNKEKFLVKENLNLFKIQEEKEEKEEKFFLIFFD